MMATSGTYRFTPTIQLKILSLLWLDTTTYSMYQDVIRPKYFTNPVHVDVCRILFDYYDKYKAAPTLEVLVEEVADLCHKSKRKTQLLQEYIDCIEKMATIRLDDAEYIKDKILSFGKRQALVDAVCESADILEREPETQYGKIEQIVKTALLVGESANDLGINIFDNIEERFLSYANEDDVIERISTGIEKLDMVLGGGLGRTEMGVVVAAPGKGKALHPDTPVLTPNGYVPIKNLNLGDEVISADGSPTKVTAIYHHTNKSLYKLEFLYGGSCICCDEHLWSVQTRQMHNNLDTSWVTLPLRDMLDNIRVEDGRCNYNIPMMTQPCQLVPRGDITLHPWILGALIGDGCSSGNLALNNTEPDVIQKFNQLLPESTVLDTLNPNVVEHNIHWVNPTYGRQSDGTYPKRPFRRMLEDLGLYGKKSYEKFIPQSYLFSSPVNRLQLLQGILDTDGWVKSRTSVEYSTTSQQLAHDVKFLAESLGCVVSGIKESMGHCTYNGERVTTRIQYTLVIHPWNGIPIVSSSKHLSKLDLSTLPRRFLKSATFVGTGDAICITVDHPSAMYVINDGIVTHNTTTLVSIGAAAVEAGYNVLHVSLENNERQIARNYDVRLLQKNKNYIENNVDKSLVAMLNIQRYRKGELRIKKYPTKTITVKTIRALLDKYKTVQQFVPDVVVVDYGAILKSSLSYTDKRNAIESNYEELRALADEYNVALWTAAQGNRGALSKKVVSMGDLAECFAIANITDVMVCICQTHKEKLKGALRLYLPKIRDSADAMILSGRIQYEIKKIEMFEMVDQQADEDEEDEGNWESTDKTVAKSAGDGDTGR